jgi:hypothetical protein
LFKEEVSWILELIWEKPVIVFYKERLKKPERKALAVVKARRLVISRVEEEDANFRGSLKDFFPFMGDIDYISSTEGCLIGMFCVGWTTKRTISAKLGGD